MFVAFFIRRPVFATVCALLIILAGAVSIPTLPIAFYPDIAPPQINVTSIFTGADAELVETSVTTPLEQQINGVEGMRYMQSTSGNDGTSNVTITFELWRNSDIASVDVQNRVAIAEPRLPAAVRQLGVSVTKSANTIVLAAGLYADKGQYSNLFISNYADVYLRDALRRIKGVADVRIFGERRYSMRLWFDPNLLAARGLTATDVLAAVREQNVDIAAGQVGQPPASAEQAYQISVRAHGRLRSPEEFGDLIVKTGTDGRIVQVKDVGRIELGAEDYTSNLRFNGLDAVGIGVFQLTDANALDVDRAVRAELARLSKQFPPGLEYVVAFDTTTVISDSISEVLFSLGAAIVLVIIVIYLFLQTARSTLIPAVTIPVSLIGTFLFIKVFGFSINALTLFGLTLATGLVVDDAIVVLENIERHMEEGQTDARTASIAAMKEVTGAVVATSLVLIAVFVPVSLFPGTTGRLYQQFALTIAFSIALSAFNALTLSPALSALLLRQGKKKKGRFFSWFNRTLDRGTRAYERVLHGLIGRKWVVVGVFVGGLLVTFLLYQRAPRAFLPDEDQGYFIVNVQAPEGVSLGYTTQVAQQIEQVVRREPEVIASFSVVGFSFTGNSPAKALVFVALKPQSERKGREQSAAAIIARLRRPLLGIGGALVIPFPPPPIRGLGTLGGFQYELQDFGNGSIDELARANFELVGAASRDSRLSGVFSSFNASAPQYALEIDREKAKSLDVGIDDVASTLAAYMASVYVNDFDYNQRSYRVYVQADAPFRSNPKDIGEYYVRSRRGQMVPLAVLVRMNQTSTAPVISHFNLFRSAEINGAAAPGKSSGEGLRAMTEVASRVLPQGYGSSWAGLALEEISAGASTLVIFGLGLLVVYLVLSAQYESFWLPLIVMLAVPLAVLGAMIGILLRGLPNDIYVQIGLVMLIGLASKNAILIVEFAEQLRGKGLDVVEAAVQAARIRLRPILMTSFAFILGVLPLVFARGAGSLSRHALGTTVFGGMIVSTILNLFFIPVLYVLFRSVRLPRAAAPAPAST
jgi:HAE1 family hydrophobic/amphiphilic exporter-1